MKIIKPGKHVAMRADFTCEPILEGKCKCCDCVFEFTESECVYSDVGNKLIDSAYFHRGLRTIAYHKIKSYHRYSVSCPNCQKLNDFKQGEEEQIEMSQGGWQYHTIKADWEEIKERERKEEGKGIYM